MTVLTSVCVHRISGACVTYGDLWGAVARAVTCPDMGERRGCFKETGVWMKENTSRLVFLCRIDLYEVL